MRAIVLTSVVLLAACNPSGFVQPPPSGSFYYPTGMALVASPSAPEGVLYVASSNFDRRYDSGLLTALPLASLELPGFGQPVPSDGPKLIRDLKIAPNQELYIDSFAGEVGTFRSN